MTIENNILEVLVEGFVSLILQIGDIDKITTQTNGRCESGRHFSVDYRHHPGPQITVTSNHLPRPRRESPLGDEKLSDTLTVETAVFDFNISPVANVMKNSSGLLDLKIL